MIVPIVDQQRINQLFKLVFGNIVLLRSILNHVRLYKKNEVVEIENRKELIEFKERDYISKLVYICKEKIVTGDLPTYGVLKEIEFTTSSDSSIEGDSIPYGVEILKFYDGLSFIQTTPFSTLPSTIHTIVNANVANSIDDNYIIPSNITSLSFKKCPNISGNKENGNGFISIPNTIKELKLGFHWINECINLHQGDIPEGVTNLSMLGYHLIKELNIGILPNSIKRLQLSFNEYDQENYSDGLFNFMPPNVEIFDLVCRCDIKIQSNLFKCTSIKKLNIEMYHSDDYSTGVERTFFIEPNSLPLSITDLRLFNYQRKIVKDIIPNGVINLKLSFYKIEGRKKNYSKDAIPNSVTSLIIE